MAVPPDRPAAASRQTPPHRFDRQPLRGAERHLPSQPEVHRQREIHTTIDRPPRVIRERPRPAASTAVAAEPVIEVSIGRIEVRALTSAPPARPASRNSAMTIDDYVAKRKAKERR